MNHIFSNLLMTCDVDGTLVDAPNPIPQRNLKAIKHFKQAGGHFAFATGRGVESLRPFVQQVQVNAPCIIFNGGGIYDYMQEQLLYSVFLPDHFRDYLKSIIKAFPQIGISAMNLQHNYSVSDFNYTSKYLGKEGIAFIQCTVDDLKGPFFKSILSLPAQMLSDVKEFIEKQGWEDVTFFASSHNFYEMLPIGINKGAALTKLALLLKIPENHIVSIGDYYNDFEILQKAGFSATVAEAPEEIKSICNLVVGRCMQGAVADLIEYLEHNFSAMP